MKIFLTLVLIGTLTLGVIPFIARAQQSEREEKASIATAITKAESTAFVLGKKNSLYDNHAFVVYTGNTVEIDALVGQREPFMGEVQVRLGSSNRFLGAGYGYMVAGSYTLRVPRDGAIAEVIDDGRSRKVRFDVDTLRVDFEKGKYYIIDRNMDDDNRITFSIEETRPENFTAFQRENPTLLDGTWSGEKKSLQGIFTMRYTIDGDRMTFEGTRGKKPFVAEGRVVYNENTMVFFLEKAVANGKNVEKFSNPNPYIWYYTLNGDILRLEVAKLGHIYSRPFFVGVTGWESHGELRKTN